MKRRLLFFAAIMLLFIRISLGQDSSRAYSEIYRAQLHFSPLRHWMNDPNGMIYSAGTYHLFFQYYPGASVWGPMHWGHAQSKDLVHWQELPVALYPDSTGYIFSGSAVLDSANSSGFGSPGRAPLVAIYTRHDPAGEKAGSKNYENQCLAYSLDEGITWKKYGQNPVLKNPGISDFRDPKVAWNTSAKKWIMTLATKDRITFYSSNDLKAWSKESEFGQGMGAHGGVWECPDLFPLTLAGQTHWVLIVNINPGGPNGGSATQYFVGQFDGRRFIPASQQTHWLDYGPDEYAGVTWSNTPGRRIFMGWMSNWEYANQVPTQLWRNSMTVARELSLKREGSEYLLCSNPVRELNSLKVSSRILKAGTTGPKFNLSSLKTSSQGTCLISLHLKRLANFKISLSNASGNELLVGYDLRKNAYYIDRTKAGESEFFKNFARIVWAPRLGTRSGEDLKLLCDATSVELFAASGENVMTAIYFPESPLTTINYTLDSNLHEDSLIVSSLKSIW